MRDPGAPSTGGSLAPEAQPPGRPECRTPPWRSSLVSAYLVLLQVVLLGYAIGGRTFAGLGIGQLYIGEITLAASVVVALLVVGSYLRGEGWKATRSMLQASMRSPAGVVLGLLVAFQIWGAIRTIPFLAAYGLSALRDGVVWGYATFALTTVIVLAAEAGALARLLRGFKLFLVLFLCAIPPLTLLTWTFYSHLPTIGVTDRFLFELRPGDVLIHCLGILVFLLALAPGHSRGSRVALGLAGFTALFYGSLNRASLLGFIAGAGLLLLLPRARRGLPWLAGSFALAFLLLWGSGVWFSAPFHPREVSARQLMVYAANPLGLTIPAAATPRLSESVEGYLRRILDSGRAGSAGGSEQASGTDPETDQVRRAGLRSAANLEADRDTTSEFRLRWWKQIVGYTIGGPYRWAGKGYGVNLATDDGFQDEPGESLRSPHNISMTILARSGVIGLGGWLALQGAWLLCMVGTLRGFLRQGRLRLAGCVIFLFAYWISILVNASFGVFLEGPVAGIWFWVVFGAGLAIALRGGAMLPDSDAGRSVAAHAASPGPDGRQAARSAAPGEARP